jgi:hypothetical protein
VVQPAAAAGIQRETLAVVVDRGRFFSSRALAAALAEAARVARSVTGVWAAAARHHPLAFPR